jgi:hypothetical protein
MSKGPVFDVQAITERLSQIPRERSKLQDRLSLLGQEQNDLETALRVLQQYGVPGVVAVPISGKVSAGGDGDGSGSANKLGPKRPEGVPPLYEMTVTVLTDAINKGKPGLKNRELVAAIGEKYWPGVQPEQVLAPIYSFVKKGRLKKTESGYFKPV